MKLTLELLQLLFATKRLLLDHLPGEKHHTVADVSVTKEIASVPTTNIAPERDFAILDRLIREKPNASVVALESMVLYSHNKTSLWLEKQPLDDRKKLIEVERRFAPSVRMKFNERQQVIETRSQDALQKRQRDIAHREMRVTQENDKLTQEVHSIGLWMNTRDIERGLQNISKKTEKLRLIKTQLKFRQKVLKQSHPDNSIFSFSYKGKAHSLEKLKDNLCKLVDGVEVHNDSTVQDHEVLSLNFEDVHLQPELLIGRRIKHRFQVKEKLVWFEGVVQQLNFVTNEFEVAYEGEEESSWFHLLDDLRNGDLILI